MEQAQKNEQEGKQAPTDINAEIRMSIGDLVIQNITLTKKNQELRTMLNTIEAQAKEAAPNK